MICPQCPPLALSVSYLDGFNISGSSLFYDTELCKCYYKLIKEFQTGNSILLLVQVHSNTVEVPRVLIGILGRQRRIPIMVKTKFRSRV